MIGSATSRALNRIGRDVTIRNFTETGTERPDPEETDGSPYTVKARVDYKSTPQQVAQPYGTDVDIDVDIFIKSDVAGGISEINDGGGELASVVEADETRFIVFLIDVQDNGLIRLACVREV